MEDVLPPVKKKDKMTIIDFKKCLKNIAKKREPKVKKPTELQRIFLNRYQKRSVYYFTSGRNVDLEVVEELSKPTKSPYNVPKKIDDFSYRVKFQEDHKLFREKEKLFDYKTRPSFRNRLSANKLERLYIPEEQIQIPGRSVVDDVDPEFFTVVAGRPIKEKTDVRSYVNDVRECFLARLRTGYQQDEMLLIDEQYSEEKNRIDTINKKYKMYTDSFETFLAEDHATATESLLEAEQEGRKTKGKREKIKSLSRELGFLKSRVLILEEKWRTCRMFQKFLYLVSPLQWREEFDYLHRNKEGSRLMADESDTSLYRIFLFGTSASHVPSLQILIEDFLKEIQSAESPKLYFEEPWQLLDIFHEMETSNLIALLHCEELTPPAEQMVSGLEKARLEFKAEVKTLQEQINDLEKEIIFEEARGNELEQKAKSLCFGLFKNLIVDKKTLNLYVYVEDVYEVCVAPNDNNLSLTEMMKFLELKNEQLLIELDMLPTNIVVKATRYHYREEARVMKEAQEAARKVHQMDILMKKLTKALQPRMDYMCTRRLVWRSEPPMEEMDKIPPPKPLSKEELDRLYFFTEFCKYTDDPSLYKPLCL